MVGRKQIYCLVIFCLMVCCHSPKREYRQAVEYWNGREIVFPELAVNIWEGIRYVLRYGRGIIGFFTMWIPTDVLPAVCGFSSGVWIHFATFFATVCICTDSFFPSSLWWLRVVLGDVYVYELFSF